MRLTDAERDELRATARSFLSGASSSERVRAVVAGEPGFDLELWEQVVALGWPGIHIAERAGGAGCGFGDLAVVLQELGRALTPSPFLASTVLATGALAPADNRSLAEPLLGPLAAGETLGAVAMAGSSGSVDRSRLSTTWRSVGGSVRLDGVAGYVLDADLADWIVVIARDAASQVAAFVVDGSAPGLHIERVPTVDLTRRLFTVAFDAVTVGDDRLLTEPGARAEQLVERMLAQGTVATALDAVGCAEQALETTAAYARERTQFGKPIGSFQAVKHHCANMAIAVEASRAAVLAAADELDGDDSAWAHTASVVGSFVGPACSEVCALALRVHGGIGFTWEHDVHLRLKRVKLDEVLFGTPSWHRRRLADAVFPSLIAS